MLDVAAESVGNRTPEKTENGKNQQKDGERSPILQASDVPALAPAAEKPADHAKSEIEKREKTGYAEKNSLPNVAENVVAHFVPDDGDDFRRGLFVDGRIPDDDALGSAETAYVRVHGGRFMPCFHPRH